MKFLWLFVGVFLYASHWGYEGHIGPKYWGYLDESFRACKYGKNQSPVNIESSDVKVARHDYHLKIHYTKIPIYILNNGHTIQVNVKNKNNYVIFDDKKYYLLQFHFHAYSEHTIDGKHYDLCMHLVHQSKDGKYLVIEILFEKGKENRFLKPIWAHLPESEEEEHFVNSYADLRLIGDNIYHYFTLKGSFTTPPCTEGVRWIISENIEPISEEQIEKFRHIFPNNVRPTNPLNNRIVEEVF